MLHSVIPQAPGNERDPGPALKELPCLVRELETSITIGSEECQGQPGPPASAVDSADSVGRTGGLPRGGDALARP